MHKGKINKLFVYFIFYFFPQSLLLSQIKASTWDSLNIYDNSNIHISVPQNWKLIYKDSYGYKYFFDASGLELPIVFAKSPVIVNVYLKEIPGVNLSSSVEKYLQDSKADTDRVYTRRKSSNLDTVQIGVNNIGIVVHMNFYKKSSALNQSCYALIVHSLKEMKSYCYTYSIQYFTKNNRIEQQMNTEILTKRVFSHLVID